MKKKVDFSTNLMKSNKNYKLQAIKIANTPLDLQAFVLLIINYKIKIILELTYLKLILNKDKSRNKTELIYN